MVPTPTVYDAYKALPGNPVIVEITSTQWQIYLGLAEQFVADSEWGTAANYAKALLVAHFAKTLGPGASGRGPVTGETVGGLSRQYGSMGTTSFDQTTWGNMYLQLRAAHVCHAPFVF